MRGPASRSDEREAGLIVTNFDRAWWGESAHSAVDKEGFSVGARVYGAWAGDRSFFLF